MVVMRAGHRLYRWEQECSPEVELTKDSMEGDRASQEGARALMKEPNSKPVLRIGRAQHPKRTKRFVNLAKEHSDKGQ